VRSLARSWVLDLNDRHIHVNAPSARALPTLLASTSCSWGGDQAQSTKDDLADLIPAGRVDRPKEIAKAVLFLASDDASFINGVELFVDGGQVQILSRAELA
jgi:NAD(P)-dependent dehydrogenase (short-subunit alcohol dehydrogenase family)